MTIGELRIDANRGARIRKLGFGSSNSDNEILLIVFAVFRVDGFVRVEHKHVCNVHDDQ